MIQTSSFVILVFLKVAYGIPSYCHNYYSEFALHDEYNKNIDPEINITISEKSFLYNIVEVNDVNQEISMKIEQLLIWYDPGIIVNSTHPFWSSGKMYLKLDGEFVQNCIWNPDIYFVSVDNIESYSPSPTAKIASPQHVFLNEFGIITSWLQVSKLTLSCGMEFTYYPFDKQVCYVIEMAKRWGTNLSINGSVSYEPEYQRDLQYEIEVETIGSCSLVGSPAFMWTVVMKRYLFKHVIQSYLPTTITVVISWLSFMIPPHSFPGRSGLLSLLILVNINIMLNIIRQSPLVSGICGLTIWSIICLIMISLALLEYAGILFRMRFITKKPMVILTPEHSENMPMVQTVASPNRCIKKRNGRRNSNSVQNSHSLPDYTQSNQSLHIDRVALFVMPLLYICISLLYWITYLRYQYHSSKYLSSSTPLTNDDYWKLYRRSF